MKHMDMTERARRDLVFMLLKSLGEVHDRNLNEVNYLEKIGVIGIRALIGVEALSLTQIFSDAASLIEENQMSVDFDEVKVLLTEAFGNLEELKQAGITFHTLQ